MQEFQVSEVMVPLTEYATVPKGSTLYEAVLALEAAQEKFEDKHTRYRHRAILVLTKTAVSSARSARWMSCGPGAKRRRYQARLTSLSQFGFSSAFVHSMRKQHRLSSSPLAELCHKASK